MTSGFQTCALREGFFNASNSDLFVSHERYRYLGHGIARNVWPNSHSTHSSIYNSNHLISSTDEDRVFSMHLVFQRRQQK
jgi:hypothetical protein